MVPQIGFLEVAKFMTALSVGRNLRDQLTVEQAMKMEEERKFRSFPGRN